MLPKMKCLSVFAVLTLILEVSIGNTFPCLVGDDPVYGGKLVNCQHQRINVLPISDNWIPPGTTSLLLDYNNISSLSMDSFAPSGSRTKLRSIRLLGLSYNTIADIKSHTFAGFGSLEDLDLGHNLINLDNESLSENVFTGLGNLLKLDLSFNENGQRIGNYPNSLFKELHNLTSLLLDTFGMDLRFGSIFNNTTGLMALTLTGGMKVIRNDSFESLESIKLLNLTIRNPDKLIRTDTDAFQYLKHLEWYTLARTNQNIKITLESLAPFVNRTMGGLVFEELNYNYKNINDFIHNSIITLDMARYLRDICVKQFALRDSKLFLIDPEVWSGPILRKCLNSIDLTYNPVKDIGGQLLYLSSLQNLTYLKVLGGKYYSAVKRPSVWQPPICPGNRRSSALGFRLDNIDYMRIKTRHFSNDTRKSPHGYLGTSNSINTTDDAPSLIYNKPGSQDLHISPTLVQGTRGRNDVFRPRADSEIVIFPKHLRVAVLNSFSYRGLDFQNEKQIIGGFNIEELHLADNGIRYFIKSPRGLPKVKLFDISKNKGSKMSSQFFDRLSIAAHLNMAYMKLDADFMAKSSKRLFETMTQLTTLDLTGNKLYFLAKGTFISNTKLSVLILAENSFESIPFNLAHLPGLCWLDMRYNFIRKLLDDDIAQLEDHAQETKSFYLSIDGNRFHCGCDSIRFLSWLQRTRINIDNDKGYPCTLDSGVPFNTGQLEDLDAMWRICHGQRAFWIVLVLVCLTMFCFSCFVIALKLKTQLKTFFLKTFWRPFIMKTPFDYATGVYIGYADQDAHLACSQLRRYIEEELRLTTYIRHRDLLSGSDMAESVTEAVNSSWRILLLVSQHFLADPWSYFLLKVSTYAVQTENPGRIVLVLIEDDDHESVLSTHLPSFLLQAVREESIIVLTPRGNISYQDKQALRTSLLYCGTDFDD